MEEVQKVRQRSRSGLIHNAGSKYYYEGIHGELRSTLCAFAFASKEESAEDAGRSTEEGERNTADGRTSRLKSRASKLSSEEFPKRENGKSVLNESRSHPEALATLTICVTSMSAEEMPRGNGATVGKWGHGRVYAVRPPRVRSQHAEDRLSKDYK
ncbi:hypothetical protein HZ326_17165 [Fusarium oxysporum f. sp. albedinis]|nr:hypothetical protein HZ326_17165 [Fusarium oxysporum f. sp. albedinis]